MTKSDDPKVPPPRETGNPSADSPRGAVSASERQTIERFFASKRLAWPATPLQARMQASKG